MEFKLSVNSNGAWKSNSASFFFLIARGAWNPSWCRTRIERELVQNVEIEFSVVLKMARGRGTRDGKELELSVKSNKACKSKNGMLLNQNG